MKFDSYHPTINLIYFAGVIACTIAFRHPVFLLISFGCSFVYSAVLNGKRAVLFNLALLPLIALWTWWYSYYHHFGVTVLRQNFIGNAITLEAVVCGAAIGLAAGSFLMWMGCVHRVFRTDKIIYLLGRVCPKLSLFAAIVLRTVPRIKKQAKKIDTAQKCIGRGSGQGPLWRRFPNALRRASILITWTLENFVEVSNSMRCRGYSLRHRTAFSIYRFDNRDRSFVILLFGCLTAAGAGALLEQTNIRYFPTISWNHITLLSCVFYAFYLLLCLLPLLLQLAGEARFRRARREIPGKRA